MLKKAKIDKGERTGSIAILCKVTVKGTDISQCEGVL